MAIPNAANPAINPNQAALTREKNTTILLARAKHIVQRFLIQDFINIQVGPPIDNDPTTIITEFAKRGDLNSLLSKVGRRIYRPINRRHRVNPRAARNQYVVEDDQERVPKVVIWQIFDCLLTACMSMAYPPRLQAPPAQATTYPFTGGLLPEEYPVPSAAHNNNHNLVHFDLDPQNVFLFDTDDTHRTMPVFKVADLGLARTPNETRNRTPANPDPPYTPAEQLELWRSRGIGKDGFHLPEQFTSDWDEVGPNSDPFSFNLGAVPPAPGPISELYNLDTVAGNYGEWSNVWQVGMVMWCSMTMMYPILPPMAALNHEAVWSYGDPITSQPYTDMYGDALCQLVSSCLAVTPGDRPMLDELREELDRIRPAQLSDADQAWFRRYLTEPSRPSQRPLARAFQ